MVLCIVLAWRFLPIEKSFFFPLIAANPFPHIQAFKTNALFYLFPVNFCRKISSRSAPNKSSFYSWIQNNILLSYLIDWKCCVLRCISSTLAIYNVGIIYILTGMSLSDKEMNGLWFFMQVVLFYVTNRKFPCQIFTRFFWISLPKHYLHLFFTLLQMRCCWQK